MKPLAVALICALIGGGAYAKDTEGCITAAGAVAPDFAMPHVAAAIAKKRLDVVVIGSASSELAGPAGTNLAYPTRLEAALGKLLPGIAVKVTTYTRPRESAEEMENKAGADRRRRQARSGGLADRHRRRYPRHRSRRFPPRAR